MTTQGETLTVELLQHNGIGLATGMFSKPQFKEKEQLVLINSALLQQGREDDATRWILDALAGRSDGRYLTVDKVNFWALCDFDDWNPESRVFHKVRVMVINHDTKDITYMKLSPEQIQSTLPNPRAIEPLQRWIKQCRKHHAFVFSQIHKRTARDYLPYRQFMSYPMFLTMIGLEDYEIDTIMAEFV